jgi:nicotinamide mononucleotide adenylyltransferase
MLIAGSDLVEGFKNEHVWNPQSLQSLIKKFGLVVIERSASVNLQSEIFNSNLLFSLHENIEIIPQAVQTELSSSKLRLLIRRGYSIKYLTDDKVIKYIKENNLYQ